MKITVDKKLPKKIILLLIGVVLVITLIYIIADLGSPSTKKANLAELYSAEEGSMAIVANGKLTNVRAINKDGKIYVRLGILTDQINSKFFYETTDKVLYYTSPTEIIEARAKDTFEGAKIFFDSTETANEPFIPDESDAKKETVAVEKTLTTDERIYVLLPYIAKYTNISYKVYDNPSRILIRSKFGECETGYADGGTAVRTNPNKKSEVVTQLGGGTKIWIVASKDGWSLVCDEENGFSGYIESSDITKKEKEQVDSVFTEPEYKYNKLNGKVNLVWHQTLSRSGTDEFKSQISKTQGVNVISPTWFSVVSSDGDIESRASHEYVEYAQSRGLKVWALVENFNTDNTLDYAALLGTKKSRTRMIETLITKALEYNIDGINVDFEGLPASAGKGYVQFIRELAIKCRKNNLFITVDCYVPSAWTQHYHRKDLAEVADYLIIMAYDEHYEGSEAGSTSSLPFVQNAIEDTLAEGVDKEQFVCGIPFYGRIWRGEGMSIKTEALGMDQMAKYMSENPNDTSWDETLGQYVIDMGDKNDPVRIWVEDEQSLTLKLDEIFDKKLAGVAGWKLGKDNSGAWSAISEYLRKAY